MAHEKRVRALDAFDAEVFVPILDTLGGRLALAGNDVAVVGNQNTNEGVEIVVGINVAAALPSVMERVEGNERQMGRPI